MNQLRSLVLASTSIAAIASAAAAQPAPAAPAAAVAEPTLGEIVVTARRRSESLQEVPQTVDAVTADTLQKLNITQFADVQNVVPGLSLQQGGDGFSSAASLRGVTFAVATGGQPTVAMYLNDAPVQALFLFDSLFDVGQVEVLRGPQGTTRGISAPSGAITVTTHKPDLSEMGGYLDGTLTDLQGRNVQGAINVPIIKDVLAVRAAATLDQNDYDGVRSVHNPLRPRMVTTSERLSVSFEPSDRFDANLTYSHLDKQLEAFDQVSGPGQGTTRDPPISPFQRTSVEDGMSDVRNHLDVVTAQIDSRIFGQHLSYVGSYQRIHVSTRNLGTTGDAGDVIPGVEYYGFTTTTSEVTTQEIRLASDPAPGRFLDYTVGAFYNWQGVGGHVTDSGPALPGAFGSPLGPVDFAAYDPRYQVPVGIDIPSSLQETSIFGSVTLHLGDRTELSGGVRHIWSVQNNQTIIQTETGLVALAPSVLGLPSCAAAGFGSTYPGTCDIPVPGGTVVGNYTNHTSETPNIYNVSLSHHVTRDLLVYANTGTAYRPPIVSVGIFGDLAGSANPALSSLSFHPSEHSRSYEVGFKWTLLDGRARLNASVFRQQFRNLTIYIPNVLYNNTSVNGGTPSLFNFTQSVDALVEGFDLGGALQVTPAWNISLQASYADGRVQGSLVPCNVGAPGAPVFNTAGLISLCPGGAASRLPYWNATLTSEYNHQLASNLDGFIRGLLTYYPQNKNRVEPDFTVDSYGLLNLYAGLRSQDGAWELSLFARNALRAQRLLDRSPVAYDASTVLGTAFSNLIPAGGSGYFATTVTPRREVGVHLRYAWGSR